MPVMSGTCMVSAINVGLSCKRCVLSYTGTGWLQDRILQDSLLQDSTLQVLSWLDNAGQCITGCLLNCPAVIYPAVSCPAESCAVVFCGALHSAQPQPSNYSVVTECQRFLYVLPAVMKVLTSLSWLARMPDKQKVWTKRSGGQLPLLMQELTCCSLTL